MGESSLNIINMLKIATTSLVLLLITSSLTTSDCSGGPGDSVTCTLCKLLVTAIDNALVETDNEQEIQQMLLEQCGRFDSQLETMCIEVVTEYTDDLIEMLVNDELAPDQVCKAIQVCT